MKQQISNSNKNQMKILDESNIQMVKVRALKKQGEQEYSQVSLSSNAIRHKMPEVILKYIIEQAKQYRGQKVVTNTNKFMKVASKLTQNKKMQDKFATSKCDICQMDVPDRQKQSMADCSHKYCASCLHQYIIYKISSFQSVQCPNQQCKKVLNEKSECYSQLPLDARKKYKKFKQYTETIKNPNLKLCPNQECEGYLNLEKNERQNQVVIVNPKCTICGKVYCSSCLFLEHEGQCDPYQLNFFQDTLHYRQCSKCKNVIQKSSGCNHMTCKCKYQFCYVCGARWTQSHMCNNPDGEPVYNEPECDCCCVTCNINCCQCWNDCCDVLSACCDSCCETVCEGCCNPLCQSCSNACQSCQSCTCCCDFPICAILFKVFFVILWVAIIAPAIYVQLLFMIAFRFIAGIAIGIFAFPCILEENGFDLQCHHIAIGIVLLPFTLLFLIGLGIKSTFAEDGIDQIQQMLKLPCQIISQVVCQD